MKPKEEIVNIRGSVSKEDVMKKGKDMSLEMPKIMELVKDKTIITHNKSELIFGLDLVENQPKILDLATNNDVNYFIMSLTDNRFKGEKGLEIIEKVVNLKLKVLNRSRIRQCSSSIHLNR